MEKFDIMNFLAKNVKPATGCTEPVAVGYATSLAYAVMSGKFKPDGKKFSIEGKADEIVIDNLIGVFIKTDRDVYKNALAVSIPGTHGQKGMAIAAAMGLFSDPNGKLNLFDGVEEDVVSKANHVLDSGKIKIGDVTDEGINSKLEVEVDLYYSINGKDRNAQVTIKDSHDNVAIVRLDNEIIYKPSTIISLEKDDMELPGNLEEMIWIVRNMTKEEKDEVYKGIEMNMRMAEEGIKNKYGLCSGIQLYRLFMEDEKSIEGIIQEVRIKAAAAGDARMGGANMPVMSTAGSGNQGITALIPVAVVGNRYVSDKERIAEGAMLSHLVTKYISEEAGYLSAMCGCTIKAGIGAAAGIAYMLTDGDENKINNAINIMAANCTGVICDGAKEGCALKLSSAAGTAAESAFMAVQGMYIPADNGIVYKRCEDTMKGIGRVSEAMVMTDLTIVNLMENKK